MKHSKRESNKLKCREKILKASRKLFNQKGFENTKIEEIAIEADISNATFYNYFPTKESLLVGTAEDLSELIYNYIDTKLSELSNSEEKIRRVVEFMTIDIKPFASLSRKMNYLNACPESVMYQKMCMREIISSMVKTAQKDGYINGDLDTETVTDLYISVFFVAIYQWTDFETSSEEVCRKRINDYLDLVLAQITVK